MQVLTTFGPRIATAIAAAVPDAEVVDLPGDLPLAPGTVGDALLAGTRSPVLHDLSPDIRWVHLFGTGADGVPPEVFVGRTVTCSRGAGAGPISEFVLAAMLAFEKRLPDTWLSAPPERWGWARLGGLSGRRLGIVGLGGIGASVARLGIAFGMDVQAMRRTDAPSPVEGVTLVRSMRELVAGAAHVVLAAPATGRTRHLVDAAAFDAMDDGAHFVNIARGTLVDQDALRAALDRGRVAMATLDVCDPEPLPAGHWLYDHPSVRLSAHVSWSSPTLTDRIVELFVENLRAHIAGRALGGVVDGAEGY